MRRALILSVLTALLPPGFADEADAGYWGGGWRAGGFVGGPAWGYRPHWAAAAIGAAAGAYYTTTYPYYGYAYPSYGYGHPAYSGYANAYPYYGYTHVTATPWRHASCSYHGYASYSWCRY